MVSNVDDNNKDIQDTTEIVEDGLFKCKICGVKFDNASAYEGHIKLLTIHSIDFFRLFFWPFTVEEREKI
jgi:hypothetical protein